MNRDWKEWEEKFERQGNEHNRDSTLKTIILSIGLIIIGLSFNIGIFMGLVLIGMGLGIFWTQHVLLNKKGEEILIKKLLELKGRCQ